VPPVSLSVLHTRSGITALNVVTAALGADPRTASIPVAFETTIPALIESLRAATSKGARAIAAYSFYSPDFEAVRADLARVREATRGLGVLHLAGGVHATAEPLSTLQAGFGLVALGEGEQTAVDLFAALAEGRDPRAAGRAEGLAWLDEGGKLVSGGPGARRPLDDFPAFNARAGKWNAIEITRGCVYACAFCQTPFMFKARFRHRSVADVQRHARLLREGGGRYVRFLSPTSLSYGAEGETPNLPAVEALLAGVREAMGPEGKIYFGTFPSEVRPEHVTREALAILRRYVDNGALVIGGQSGSERVLQQTRRGHGVEPVLEAVRRCVEAGFEPHVDFLLGLPGEERVDREASLLLARRLSALGARIHSHSFLPLPGTPLGGALPSQLEEETVLAMSQLESEGAMYGQWRRQQEIAQRLVSLRRPGRSA
jgi:B12-binding domain/radical SAM domain protein